jgi:hypothetical protein
VEKGKVASGCGTKQVSEGEVVFYELPGVEVLVAGDRLDLANLSLREIPMNHGNARRDLVHQFLDRVFARLALLIGPVPLMTEEHHFIHGDVVDPSAETLDALHGVI